jgi:hypothetical protein
LNDPPQDRSQPLVPPRPLTFELFAFRFRFRAMESLYFPPGKAGNVIRGTLGRIFRKFVCAPACPGSRTCGQRTVCAYARLFEPTAIAEGPSGLADWPRPFVIRAAHLDGSRFRPQEQFHFDLNVFEMRDPALAYFAFSFSQLMREGLGPGRPGAELIAIHQFESTGQAGAKGMDEAEPRLGAQIFDGHTLSDPQPLILALDALSFSASSNKSLNHTQPALSPADPAPQPPAHMDPRTSVAATGQRIRVRFLTPTELKAEGRVVREPEFGVLFARVRDRLHTLRSLYGEGPLPLDFSAAGERARAVKLIGSDLRWEMSERRSGRTGQTHQLGGFTGWAEYEGELAEFVPYLRAATWTGVGRQTTWGKGHIEVQR